MVHYAVLYGMYSAGLLAPSWLGVVVGVGSCIVVGGLVWRFIERPLGEAMRRRLLRAFGLEPGDR